MNENPSYSSYSYGSYRNVPLALKLKVLFGGVITQMGWFFMGFGSIFVFIFVGNADFSDWYLSEKNPKAIGKITEIKPTNTTVNDRYVYACHYEFTASDGKKVQGVSYTSGRLPNQGDEVEIQYQEGKPEYSRVKGMSKGMFPPIVLLVLLFPALGLGLVLAHLLWAKNAVHLLQNGIITRGKLLRTEMTSTQINNQPVMKLFFQFKAMDGQ